MALFDGLRRLFRPNYYYVYSGDYGVRVCDLDAAQLYKTQPNLRAVISFLAENAAQDAKRKRKAYVRDVSRRTAASPNGHSREDAGYMPARGSTAYSSAGYARSFPAGRSRS